MDTMKKKFNQSLLLDKGIVLQSGAVCHNKINLISGAISAPLIETIWIFSGYDKEAMERTVALFNHLYNEGCEIEMLALLRICSDIVGVQLPQDFELLAEHEKARHYFLFSFLLDIADCIQSIISDLDSE
jgi:hypothetical protein